MTNEQLAALAQDLDNNELVPVLWDKVKDLLYMKAQRAYTAHGKTFKRCGVELSDIRQSCYIVFLTALKGYKPEQGNEFTSYLNYPFINQIKELTQTRTSKTEPLNATVSIDAPLCDDSGSYHTLSDTLPDSTNIEADVLDRMEQEEESRLIRDAVKSLPKQQREAVWDFYFEGLTLHEIANKCKCSPQNISQFKAAGLRTLRQSAILKQLYGEQVKHDLWNRIRHLEYMPDYFELISKVRE